MITAVSDREPTDAAFRVARLRMLLAVMFCYVFFYTGRQAFGFAIPGIQEEYHLSKTQLGWCSSAMLWAYALGQIVNGQLADRFGGRFMMTAGAICSFALNWVVSLGTGLFSIAAPWTFNGLAQSMGWAPGSRILSNWWDKDHRGVVYGWYVFAAGSSSIVTYVMASLVVDHGWRWIFRLPVFGLLLGGAVLWIVARDRPADLDLPNLPLEAGESAAAPQETAWHRYKVALGHARFMMASFSIGFQSLARYGLLVWVPVHFLGTDWKNSPERWISVALPVGMALGAITNGWLSDRFFKGARSQAIQIFLLCAAVSAGALWLLPRGHGLVIPMLMLTGFFVYGPQAGYWALCPDLLGRRHAGTGTGVMNFFAYALAGLGEPMTGYLIEQNPLHAHTPTSIVFLIVAIASLIGAGLMRLARC